MEERDYYKTLGVEPNASRDAIKSAYRRLAKKYHPDLSHGATSSHFSKITEAYRALISPKKSFVYNGLANTNMDEIARDASKTMDWISKDTHSLMHKISEESRKTLESIVKGLKSKTTVFIISILGGIVLSAFSIKSTGYAINGLTTTNTGLLGLILFVFGLFGLIFNINRKK